ncbi:MAG: alanine racemase [Candidatus Neomarinimicrobiota bacterium]
MYRPVAEINLDRLIRNYRKICQHVGNVKVMPVVKANAYGHGAVPVSKALESEGVSFLSVFTLGEATDLRENGIRSDILLFSRTTEDYLQSAVERNITLNISWPDEIPMVSAFVRRTGKGPKIHLKIDTGMTRLGVSYDEALEVLRELKKHPEIQLEGIYSHFATADEGDRTYAYLQLERFSKIVEVSRDMNIPVKYYHIGNSGGVLNIPESFHDMVRVGMLMYGAYPSDETTECVEVEPVMNFKGPIVVVRWVKAGAPISYGSEYTPESDAFIGVIQTGFADGFPRNWYRRGYVGYKGKDYKIAGRICMDQFMVNFEDDEPQVGEEVLFFGDDGLNRIRVEDIAKDIDTTTYALMTAVGGRTERTYVGGNG